MLVNPTNSSVPQSSDDLTAELIKALRAQVPHVFSEAGVDLDKLKARSAKTWSKAKSVTA